MYQCENCGFTVKPKTACIKVVAERHGIEAGPNLCGQIKKEIKLCPKCKEFYDKGGVLMLGAAKKAEAARQEKRRFFLTKAEAQGKEPVPGKKVYRKKAFA